jgi:hypothetical protein
MLKGVSPPGGKHIPRCYSNRTVNRRIAAISLITLSTVSLFLAGCDKEETVTTHAWPKDPQSQPVIWTAPEGWNPLPPNRQFAQYAAFTTGEGDDAIKVTVSFLMPDAEGASDLLLNVNRWRKQLELPPAEAPELQRLVVPSRQGDLLVQQVDMSAPSGNRMRAAIVPRQDRIWFFKMAGATDLVERQKEKFDAFVESARFLSPVGTPLAAAEPAPPAPATEAPSSELSFTLPPGWSRQPNANAMRKLTLSTGGDKPAQLIVTQLSSNFGGMAMNFARWRGEVGLPPTSDASDARESSIRVGTADGLLVDLSGPGKDGATPMRSLIARVNQGDATWFFKILGPAETVTRQRGSFEAFLASVRLPSEVVK